MMCFSKKVGVLLALACWQDPCGTECRVELRADTATIHLFFDAANFAGHGKAVPFPANPSGRHPLTAPKTPLKLGLVDFSSLPDDTLTRPQQTAALLGCHKASINRYAQAGLLKKIKIGGITGYRLGDLRALINGQVAEPVAGDLTALIGRGQA